MVISTKDGAFANYVMFCFYWRDSPRIEKRKQSRKGWRVTVKSTQVYNYKLPKESHARYISLRSLKHYLNPTRLIFKHKHTPLPPTLSVNSNKCILYTNWMCSQRLERGNFSFCFSRFYFYSHMNPVSLPVFLFLAPSVLSYNDSICERNWKWIFVVKYFWSNQNFSVTMHNGIEKLATCFPWATKPFIRFLPLHNAWARAL